MVERPKVHSSLAEKELDKAETQFAKFDEKIKELTLDQMNKAPLRQDAPQVEMSQEDIAKSKDIYLKPIKSISSKEPFNEKWREEYNFCCEYVHILAENKEMIGQTMEFWTKPFPGMPAQFWNVPANKPIWVPRHVADQIKGCKYHQLSMDESKVSGNHQFGTDYGQFVVDNIVQRLDAKPVPKERSFSMRQTSFA